MVAMPPISLALDYNPSSLSCEAANLNNDVVFAAAAWSIAKREPSFVHVRPSQKCWSKIAVGKLIPNADSEREAEQERQQSLMLRVGALLEIL